MRPFCIYKTVGLFNMIDLVLLRNNPEEIIVALKKKEPAYDAQRLYELDGHVRTILLAVEQLRSKK